MFGDEAYWLAVLFGLIRAQILAPLGIVIALALSVHILLTKRDVGAAIGWIGLVWFSPLPGGVVYLVFGVNRVQRRARVLREGPRAVPRDVPAGSPREDHLAPLERAERHLTRRATVAGNAITMLRNGDEVYPAMLAAIAGARASIALSTYILRDDEAGAPIIDALIAAHARRVVVRVLLDGVGSGYFVSPAYRRLRRAGVRVARFLHSPLPWRMPFLNLRSHKKMLLIDGRHGFTGGMNIGAENLVARRPRHPVRDTHFTVAGPILAQLVEAFANDWAFVTGEELEGPAWSVAPGASGAAVARVVTSGPDEDVEKIEMLVLQAVACAQRSIAIMTPYFLPDERLVTALALAALRGVAVDVVVPARSNHLLVDWASEANIAPLLEGGVRIWRNPAPFDHSKVMVVDDAWCLIGSANWDMRSFRLNFELNMEVFHDDLAGTLSAHMVACRGPRITLGEIAATPLPIRLRNAAARLLLPYL